MKKLKYILLKIKLTVNLHLSIEVRKWGVGSIHNNLISRTEVPELNVNERQCKQTLQKKGE